MESPDIHTTKYLFDRIASGEEAAFRALYDIYRSKIHFFVFHIVERGADAEELVQDIFMKLWARRESLAEVGNPDSYLFVMARNRALDHLNSAMRERRMMSVLADNTDVFENTTEEEIDFNESRKLIGAAVATLPAQQAKVFHLAKELGLKRSEIAEQLGISENTVRGHLFEAIKTIKKYLKDHGDIALLYFLWHYF